MKDHFKILFYEWRAYNGRDVLSVFRELGNDVETFTGEFENANEDASFENNLDTILSKGDNYDFVFSIDYFTIIAEVCHARRIPYVSWSCDAALTSMYHKSVYYPENYIFFFDKVDHLEFVGKGLSNVYYLPLAPNAERIRNTLENKRIPEKLSCIYKNTMSEEKSISFVGTMYYKNRYDALVETFPDYLRGYLDAVIEAQCEVTGGIITEILLKPHILEMIEERYRLEKHEDSEADLAMYFSRSVLGYKVANVERTRALQGLGLKFGVNLYSTEEYQGYGVKELGPVDYWDEMPFVFKNSFINLNFTIPNIASGIPLRVWDIMASGGLCFTNYRAELEEYFTPGEDLVIFEGQEDLENKAAHYLNHPEKGRQIAANGWIKVTEFYDLKVRIRELIDIIKRELNY